MTGRSYSTLMSPADKFHSLDASPSRKSILSKRTFEKPFGGGDGTDSFDPFKRIIDIIGETMIQPH